MDIEGNPNNEEHPSNHNLHVEEEKIVKKIKDNE
jgi:hypothetical protein